jgi:hypothetical protein
VSNGVSSDVNDHDSSRGSGHDQHDRLLIVRLADGDTADDELAAARALVEQCPDCARLAADINLLRSATATLPAPVRQRDFRLSAEQAARLRGSALERLLRRLAAPRAAMLRPVASVGLALGLTIAVVGAALPQALNQMTVFGPDGGDLAAPTGTGGQTGQPPRQAASTTPADVEGGQFGSPVAPGGDADVPSPAAAQPTPSSSPANDVKVEPSPGCGQDLPPASPLPVTTSATAPDPTPVAPDQTLLPAPPSPAAPPSPVSVPATSPNPTYNDVVSQPSPGCTTGTALATPLPATTGATGSGEAPRPPDAGATPTAGGQEYSALTPSPTAAAAVVPPADQSTGGAAGQADLTDLLRLGLIYGGVTLALLAFVLLLLAFYARRRMDDPLLR